VFADADIYYFDEPYAGLFPEKQLIVTKLIKKLKKDKKTIVLIDHNINIIKKLSDNCIIIDSGKVVAQGKTKEVLNNNIIKIYFGI
jgi:ABC-type branched-subunit amino acid transport system ATPase component